MNLAIFYTGIARRFMILQADRDLYVHDKAKNQRKRTREKYNEKIIPSRFSCDDPVIILNPITQDSAALPQPHESKGLYKNIQHFNNGKRIRTYRDKEFFKDC